MAEKKIVSAKEAFEQKKFELKEEELEKVAGGMIGHISCSNPQCVYYRSCFIVGAGAYCNKCGAPMEWVDEGFYVPD